MHKIPDNLNQAGISKSDSTFQSEGAIKRVRKREKCVILTGS